MQKYLEKVRIWLKSDTCCQETTDEKKKKVSGEAEKINKTKGKKTKKGKKPLKAAKTNTQRSEKSGSDRKETLSSPPKTRFGKVCAGIRHFIHKYPKHCMAGSCMLLIFLAGIYFSCTFSYGYTVSVANERIFSVLEPEEVSQAVAQLEKKEKERLGAVIDYHSKVQQTKNIVRNDSLKSGDEMIEILEQKLGSSVDAFAIVVNGKPCVYVVDQKTAETVLERLKEIGSYVNEGEILREVILKENVEIESCQTPVRSLYSEEGALNLIRTGEEHPSIYTVKSGDTLWTIARENNINVKKIVAFNHVNENEILVVGQELILTKSDPYISVVATIERQETEQIPYETELREDNSTEGLRVLQDGKNGERVVSYLSTRVNGITIAEYVTAEKITQEVQNLIVIHGNQIALASRGKYSSGYYASMESRLAYPTNGTITQPFREGHTGLDIGNDIGTEIVAADDGIVTYVHRSNVSYGNYCVIDHQNGIVTRYAHCEEVYVIPGQKVYVGQQIASMGSTGNSTGPHLHFEVLLNGEFQDPFLYL